MKKPISFVAVLLVACFIYGCIVIIRLFASLDDRVDKEDIFSYVQENEEIILECINSNDSEPLQDSGIIKEIKPRGEYIEFSCGGSGFGSATTYCGFYYSAKDDMRAIWCGPMDNRAFSKSGDGYLWEENGGDNWYYTENICGHFYYYYSHF